MCNPYFYNMAMMKTDKLSKTAGILLVILGLLCNEAVLGYYLSDDRIIHSVYCRAMILALDVTLVGWGFYLARGYSKVKILGFKTKFWIFILVLAVFFMSERALYALVYPSTRFQITGEIINRVNTAEKVVALSFDDGPTEPYTQELLEVLDRHNVKATFFMVGKNIEENMEIAKAVHQRGHQLGNHTYSHRAMVYVKPSEVQYELERTNDLLIKIGVNDEIMFRPPFGLKFIVLPMVLKSMKMKCIMWDVEPKDWAHPPSNEVVEYVINHAKNGSIILMHDADECPDVARSADLIITNLKARGYQFKTVEELLKYSSK